MGLIPERPLWEVLPEPRRTGHFLPRRTRHASYHNPGHAVHESHGAAISARMPDIRIGLSHRSATGVCRFPASRPRRASASDADGDPLRLQDPRPLVPRCPPSRLVPSLQRRAPPAWPPGMARSKRSSGSAAVAVRPEALAATRAPWAPRPLEAAQNLPDTRQKGAAPRYPCARVFCASDTAEWQTAGFVCESRLDKPPRKGANQHAE